MDKTIAEAASGETAYGAAPKDSLSQAKGQKSNIYMLLLNFWRLNLFNLFFVAFLTTAYHERLTTEKSASGEQKCPINN